MIHPNRHTERRRSLGQRVSGPILLMGCGDRSRNLPMNKLPFRQDSTFLYFTGCVLPNAALIIVGGESTLFVPNPADDDALWHGEADDFNALRRRFDVDEVADISDLEATVRRLQPRTLAIADESVNARIGEWLGCTLCFGLNYGDDSLVDAVIAMRRTKGADELHEMRLAALDTAAAHRAVLGATRPGGHERGLAALFEAVLALRGSVPGYSTILTQSGEVLHHHGHEQELKAGRLLLLDGGGERVDSGYGADVTRTWPVNGRFDGRQRAAYDAVLEAQEAAIAKVRAGNRYREVHATACRVLARWLADEKLLRVSPDESVEIGAHAIFFPHGIGHHLGLDVHDLENFGDRPSYPARQGRTPLFGTAYLRLDLPLVPGWVVTVEPGFYVVPAILRDRALRERLGQAVDFERASSWIGFGGIRIEDDIAVTEGEPENLTAAIPKRATDLEALIGTGPCLEDLF